MLAENIGYLVDDERRWQAIAELDRVVGLARANCLRVLTRLGYGSPDRSYAASYRRAQAAATAELPCSALALVRAYQLLRRHGREVCTRKDPACAQCPLAAGCPSAGRASPLY